ncbi:MAG: site-2 protease family protein [Candidatus Levybacteria bacterium]|nr:site-2 protease family protein [Candidatus Levybacteria bacterium]
MNKGFQIGKLFEIEITIDPSWLFIFLLVTWNLAFGVFPQLQPQWGLPLQLAVGIATSILFFASVLVHEMAHSLVAKARGLPIKRITLFLFGGVSNLEREPESAKTEFLMAVVGPITSIALGFLLLFLGGQTMQNGLNPAMIPDSLSPAISPIQTLLLWLGPINIVLGLFNLLPGFPLDGGRIFRSLIWSITKNLRTSTRIAAFVGQAIGFIFIFLGISMVFGIQVPFFGTGLGGLWIAFIGWFLTSAASSSYQQVVLRDLLGDVPVSKIMRNDISPVSPSLSINQLVDEYMIGTDKHVFPVMSNSRLEGIICLEDIQKISRDKWSEKKVKDVMTSYKKLDIANLSDTVSVALEKITKNDIGQVPVVENNKFLGMLSRRDVLLWLSLRAKDGELKEVENNI